MADNSVFITGAAEGAFTDALNGLPPWATQDTAEHIEMYLRKSLDVQTKSLAQLIKSATSKGNGLSADDVDKVNKGLDEYIKNLAKANKEGEKQQKRAKDDEKAEKQKREREKKDKLFNDRVNFALGNLAAIGTKVFKAESAYLDVYDSLYKSGINVLNGQDETTSGFDMLNKLVNQTGLRLETLQKVMEKYSTTVNAVGVAKFGKTLSMTNTKLIALGYSSEQQAELLGTLMEAESGYSDIRGKSADSLAADAIKLGADLNKLSQTVGLSRQQLQENMKANARSADSTLVAATYGEEAAKRVAEFTAGFKDQSVGKVFQQMAAAIDPVFTQAYKDLQHAGLGDLANQLGRLAKDARYLDPTEAQKRLDSLLKGISPGTISALQSQLAAGNQSAQASLELINGLQQQARGVSNATEKQQDSATKTEATIAGLQTQVEKFTASLQAAFFPLESQVNAVTGAMKLLNDAIYGVIGKINGETRSWIGVGVIATGLIASVTLAIRKFDAITSKLLNGKGVVTRAFKSLGSGIANGAKAIFGFIKRPFMAAGEFISSAFSGMGTKLTNLWANILSKISAVGDGIVSAGTWLKNAITGIGSNIGTWFKNAFSAIVDGIVAAGSWIKNVFSKFFGSIGTLFEGLLSRVGPILADLGAFLGKVLGFAGRFLGVLGALWGAFDIGYMIGTQLNKILSKFEFVTKLFDFVFQAIDKLLSYIPGSIGSDARDRIEGRRKLEEQEAKADEERKARVDKQNTKPTPQPQTQQPTVVVVTPPAQAKQSTLEKVVTVPKTPMRSTIDSPSAGNAPKEEQPSTNTEMAASIPSSQPGSSLEKAARNTDINSLLNYQGLLQEQILLGINGLLAVNKDILRYTRNQ